MTLARQRALLVAALLLPLAALAADWAMTHRQAQQGEDWLIPVEGYDPRDLLRGHYIRFRYAWPMVTEGDKSSPPPTPDALCVTGVAPHIRSVRPASQLWGQALPSDAGDCAIILRATASARQEARGLESGILYASQEQATALSRKLADARLQAMVRVRVRPDGVLRPIAMEFRARLPR